MLLSNKELIQIKGHWMWRVVATNNDGGDILSSENSKKLKGLLMRELVKY